MAVAIILVVCLVAMLRSSIFGIFLSSEKTSTNSLTMKEVVVECNQEFADRLQNIQDENVLPQELLSTEQDRKNNQFNVSTLLNKIPSMLKSSLFSNKENK